SSSWTSVSTGDSHVLAIASNGALYAWGHNEHGQLGDGTNLERSTPVRIGMDNNWTSVSAGFEFSYGLKSNNTLYSWGFNANGQLGQGNTTPNNTPTQIGTNDMWKFIGAGSSFAFAINMNGELFGCGFNGGGQLGTGDSQQKLTLTKVGNDNTWEKIAGASGAVLQGVILGNHTIGTKSQTENICGAGDGREGQLGNGVRAGGNTFQCVTSTGIFDLASSESNLDLYPNPTDGSFSLKIKNWQDFNSYEILSVSGQVVKQGAISGDNLDVDISNVEAGVYLVKIVGKNQNLIERITKR
ncbi:MAG: T9SS type A sorting domain-containing protein, partial [Luteibaculum sp.]